MAVGGAYYLEWLSGKVVPKTWNATYLKLTIVELIKLYTLFSPYRFVPKEDFRSGRF